MEKKHHLMIGVLIIIVLGISVYYDGFYGINSQNTLFQVSTMNALSQGSYEGKISSGDLKMYGDTGIGTFDGLDGEMIELNGDIYQIKSNGTVYLVNKSLDVPYAIVTSFKAGKIVVINESMNYTKLQQYLTTTLPSKNLIYSIKIKGNFESIKARSPPKQTKPYVNLTEALKHQGVFYFNDINGTIVGFWYPESASSVNLNEYHFHFISDDRNSGGHILDCRLNNAIIEIDYISCAYIMFPESNEFTKFNFAPS